MKALDDIAKQAAEQMRCPLGQAGAADPDVVKLISKDCKP